MTRFHRSKAQATLRTRGQLRRRFHPRLEELESRLVPSTSIPLNPSSWVDLGPAPLMGNVAYSGRVTGLATDPTNASIIYAATAGGGVWKTTTGGNSWFPTMDNLRFGNGDPIPMFMGAVAVAPSNPQVVYAGSGEANNTPSDSFYGVGIHVSTNGGSSWNLSGPDYAALRGTAIAQIVVDPGDPNTAWAAVSNTATNGMAPPNGTGIYRTTDGGVNWTNVTMASLPGTTAFAWSAVVIDPTTTTAFGGNATLFAAVGNPRGTLGTNGIYQSTDSGANWTLVDNLPGATPPPQARTDGRIALALSHPAGTANATLYASIANATNGKLLAFDASFDSGRTWRQQNPPDFVNPQGSYDMVVAADPDNPLTVYAGGSSGSNSFIQSTDGGSTWRDVSASLVGTTTHADHHALAFSRNRNEIDGNHDLIDGNDGGVWSLHFTIPPPPLLFHRSPSNHSSSGRISTATWRSPSSPASPSSRATATWSGAAARTTAPRGSTTTEHGPSSSQATAASSASIRPTPRRSTTPSAKTPGTGRMSSCAPTTPSTRPRPGPISPAASSGWPTPTSTRPT